MAQEGLTVEELTKLFSVLSHDLKSPIFSVDGFSELLIADYSDRLDEEGQDFLRRIRSSVQQMKKVLDEMSRVVKLLSRPTAPRSTPLREIVEEVLLKYNYMIEDGGVKVDVPADLPTVDIDPEKMREAIGALISNALFFNGRFVLSDALLAVNLVGLAAAVVPFLTLTIAYSFLAAAHFALPPNSTLEGCDRWPR